MAKKQAQTYKSAVQEIEKIISDIEEETVDVDVLAERVKRAAELIRFCKEKLMKTEKDVAQVLEEFENEGKDEKKSNELF